MTGVHPGLTREIEKVARHNVAAELTRLVDEQLLAVGSDARNELIFVLRDEIDSLRQEVQRWEDKTLHYFDEGDRWRERSSPCAGSETGRWISASGSSNAR